MVGFLHSHWNSFTSKFWIFAKYVFISFSIILVIITSAGVYGFLSAAYQVTADADRINLERISILERKKKMFSDRVAELKSEKINIQQNISALTKSLSTDNQYQTIDRRTGNVLTQIQSTSKKGIQTQLQAENSRRDAIESQININLDSVQVYEIAIIEAVQQNSAGSELGPLKYISRLTGVEMDSVVNFFIILLVIVIDPLAIFLLIAALYSAENKSDFEPMQIQKQDPIIHPANPIEPQQEIIEEDVKIEPEQPEKFIRRKKRGRPRTANKIPIDQVIPETSERDSIARTFVENDLSPEIMRRLSDSLSNKKLSFGQKKSMSHQEIKEWEKNNG